MAAFYCLYRLPSTVYVLYLRIAKLRTIMLDWDDFQDFDFQEFNEEEDRIRKEQQRREEEQRRRWLQ